MDTRIKEKLDLWLEKADADMKAELIAVGDDENELYERFYKELEFGTGGLRGVIGAGTNRMNVHTVCKATQGLADYLVANFKSSCVAISYDSRNKSDEFARAAACVLAGNGIKVYIYRELMPTPALSFAVRELGCRAGIMVTASHNPAKYNGYKAYGPDGCQMNLEMSEYVLSLINKVDIFDGVKRADFDKALAEGDIEYISDEVINKYYNCVVAQQINPEVLKKADMHIVYTPLNGTGNKPVREVLKRLGVTNIDIVPEQENPDGNFTTCPYPNPEIREALQKGLELCEKVGCELLLATDPDCDRVGIAVKNNGEYELLTGNQVGALLLDYIAKNRIKNGTMPKNPIAVKTIVTTPLICAICEEYGIELVDVLTGFKFIGEQILMLEEKGEENRYIFGFEESYGYLSGTYVRDKDAVNASALIVEMASYYKLEGKNLCEVLDSLYKKHGRYLDSQDNVVFEGASGMQKMADIMADLRENAPTTIAGLKVLTFVDIQNSISVNCVTGEKSEVLLPKSNVLCFYLENNASVIVRPSGTEPKIKIYYCAKADDINAAQALRERMAEDIKSRF